MIVIFLVLLALRSILSFQGVSLTLFELKWLLIGQRSAEGFLMYEEIFDYTGPLSAFFYRIIDYLFGKSQQAHHIISSFWLFLNAIIFNSFLKRNKNFSETNDLPALFFVLLAVAIPDFMSLSPQMMSMTFILLGLHNVFERIANEVTDDLFLYAGIYVGIATLFYPPALVFFFVFLISFFLFSTPKMRRIALYFNGFLIPLALTFSFFYWHDNGFHAWHALVNRGFFGQEVRYLSGAENFYCFGIPIFIGLAATGITFFSGHFSSFQNKSAQAMVLMILGALIVIWLDVETSPVQMLYLVPSMSFFLAHYLLILRKRWAKIWIPLVVVGALILAPYFSYVQLDMDTIRVKERTDRFSKRRMMLLGDNLSALDDQELSSPFLDAQLSKERVALLDDAASAQALMRIIEEAPPAVIIDAWALIPKIFSRLPARSKTFRKQKDGYYVRISN